MRPPRTTGLLLACIAGAMLAGVTPAWNGVARASAQTSVGALAELAAPEELRARFNADREHTRLVLLLSPT